MPKIGEIRCSKTIGRNYRCYFAWRACADCGKERWVEKRAPYIRCRACSNKNRRMEKHANWKGGLWKDAKGYIYIKLPKDDFFYPMTNHQDYVREHRLVMARYLGRCLQGWEVVHHKGIRYTGIGNKSDNLMDNLELGNSLGEHSGNHSKGYRDGYTKGFTDGRNAKIRQLEARIKGLELYLRRN